MNQEIFCERLRKVRADKGLSQAQAAAGIGMTEAGYQNYEVGRRLPTIEKLYALADFFEVSIDYLLGRVDHP